MATLHIFNCSDIKTFASHPRSGKKCLKTSYVLPYVPNVSR